MKAEIAKLAQGAGQSLASLGTNDDKLWALAKQSTAQDARLRRTIRS